VEELSAEACAVSDEFSSFFCASSPASDKKEEPLTGSEIKILYLRIESGSKKRVDRFQKNFLSMTRSFFESFLEKNPAGKNSENYF
jgi:hypothetical protein